VASLLAGMIDNKPASWLTLMAGDYEALGQYAERVQSSIGVWGRYTE